MPSSHGQGEGVLVMMWSVTGEEVGKTRRSDKEEEEGEGEGVESGDLTVATGRSGGALER